MRKIVMEMRTISLIVLGIVSVLAIKPIPDRDAKIVKQTLDIHPDGSYKHAYELSSGAYASEEGVGGVSAIGQFGYFAPDGTPFYISYTADENGFKAYGNHLPTPPPIPEAIQRALDYIKAHAPRQT
ncbi:unnamed protein product [Hermetia illucens]|uniref:Pupal cuticle protein Edg-78E n=2 Tax=Hermetia illucens TaxID=343691 RepID=A0A7R8YPS6_HERIL|nr:unnamed protein product [Hermetia illucens]